MSEQYFSKKSRFFTKVHVIAVLQGWEPELRSGIGAGAAETGSEPELAQKSQVLTGPTYPIFSTK